MLSAQAFTFIGLTIVFSTAVKILQRYVLKETEPYAYSLLTQIIATIVWIPVVLTHFTWPSSNAAWIVIAISGVLWAGLSLTNAMANKGTEVSIREPLSQSKLIWGMLLGLLLLGETMTLQRTIGTIIIFLGSSLLLWHPEKRFGRLSDPGVRLTLGVAVFGTIVASIDKFSQHWFKPEMYGFFVYFIPAIVLLAFLPGRTHHIRHLMKHRGKTAILAILLSICGYYFTLKAYSTADFTIVYPLIQLTTLFTVVGGIVLLKEDSHLWQRITATVIIVAGAILIGF